MQWFGLLSLLKSGSLEDGKITRGAIYVVVILMVTTTAGVEMIGGTGINPYPQGGKQVQIISPSLQPAKNNLQLYTFFGTVITPSPSIPVVSIVPTTPHTPRKFCASDDDDGIAYPPDCQCIDQTINCKGGVGTHDDGTPYIVNLCGSDLAPHDGRYCVEKPVIYLYPESPTLVSVGVKSTGKVVVSDPLYPDGGWKNVLAYPSGQLDYQGKIYRELFYESQVGKINQPTTGLVIASSDISDRLKDITSRFGLNEVEQKEFLAYWLPRLASYHSPYFLFSVIDPVEKERIDAVDITPKPDTFISFLAYFKPLTVPYTNLPPLVVPAIPQRNGFTAVEWGGMVGR